VSSTFIVQYFESLASVEYLLHFGLVAEVLKIGRNSCTLLERQLTMDSCGGVTCVKFSGSSIE
jgi:hypothetical protein